MQRPRRGRPQGEHLLSLPHIPHETSLAFLHSRLANQSDFLVACSAGRRVRPRGRRACRTITSGDATGKSESRFTYPITVTMVQARSVQRNAVASRLSVNTSTGLISGTPTAAGVYTNVTVERNN